MLVLSKVHYLNMCLQCFMNLSKGSPFSIPDISIPDSYFDWRKMTDKLHVSQFLKKGEEIWF